MKDTKIMLLFVCFFMLVACSENVPDNLPVEPLQETGEVEAVEEEEDVPELVEGETEAELEPVEEPEAVAKEKTDSTLDLKQIFVKSAEAMKQLDGMKVEATAVSTQSNRYQDSVITWDMERDYNWTSGEVIHEFISVSDQRGEDPMRLELYHDGQGMHYVQDLDYSQGEWSYEETFVGGYHHFYERGELDLLLYADYTKSFVFVEEGENYLVSFSGDDESFENLIFGLYYHLDAGFYDEEGLPEEDYFGITGTFNMTIDKETFLITEWEMEYEGGRYTEELGDYYNIEKATYKNSNFNEYDLLEIPEEVFRSRN